jgi:hypothetical protein
MCPLLSFLPRSSSVPASCWQADIETTYLEADQGYCTDIRDEYVRHFLTGELVTGQAWEAVLSKSLLPRISKRDVEQRAGRFSHTCSAVFKTVEYRWVGFVMGAATMVGGLGGEGGG